MSTFTEYFLGSQERNGMRDEQLAIHSCPELIECIREVGFLPLLESGIQGYIAEAMLAEECRFTQFPDGSWEWALWQWKGSVVREGNCVYGKFFAGKAGFISREWWPDFCNWRRSNHPAPEEGSIEEAILVTLREHGSMIARELRAEDFVYPVDKHGREYGFGWSLLTTPEQWLGREACQCKRTPTESYQRMEEHLSHLLPHATGKQIEKLLK